MLLTPAREIHRPLPPRLWRPASPHVLRSDRTLRCVGGLWRPGFAGPKSFRRPQTESGGGGMAITFLGSAVSGSDLTTYTFTDQPLGDPAADRRIIVAVGGRNINAAPNSVTVAGVPANLVVTSAGSLNNSASIYIADVPTGIAGDIAVVWPSGIQRCGIGFWALTGPGSSTAADTEAANGDPVSIALTVPANGAGVGYTFTTGDAGDCSWSGMTERYEEEVEPSILHSGADLTSVDGGGISVGYNWLGSPTTTPAAVFASWGP